MTLWRAIFWTAVSAVAYGAVFPPLRWWPLGWIALAPLFVVLGEVPPRRAAVLGAFWAIAMAYSVGDWMPRAVIRYFEQPLPVGVVVFLACSIVTASIQYGAFAVVYHRLTRYGPGFQPWLVAVGWVAAELARVKPVTGNPWALIGYGQGDVSALVQVADLGGVYAVGFPVIMVNAAVAMTWIAWRRGEPMRRVVVPLGGVGLLVAGVFAYGLIRLGEEADSPGRAGVPVTVVQGNLSLGTQWLPEFYGRNLGVYSTLTGQALARRPAALVVWPENALTFFLEREPAYRGYIAAMLTRFGAELLTGGPRIMSAGTGDQPTYRSGAFLVTPAGEIAGLYEKQSLVPFAEYFPLPQLDFLRRRFGRVREFVPGTARAPVPTVAGPAGVMICNEAMFGENGIERVRAGARWLAVLTNDGWVGEPRYAAIAMEMTRLRAVEVRRWMVRSSTSGPSAIVDPWGRLTQSLDLETRGTIDGYVVPRDGLTVYAEIGDAFAWMCAAVAAVAVISRRRTARVS